MVLLINPSYEKAATLGPFARYITAQLPLSAGLLAGYLRSRNTAVRVIDEQLHPVQERTLASIIEEQGIRIIGLSVLTLTSGRAYELGALIKRRWPQVTVIMGGVHVTLLPEEPLQRGVADIVVRNEGEVTLGELVGRIRGGRPYDDVAGISFLRGGAVVHNPERPLIEDLDSLPQFPYDLFAQDLERYQFGNILASRGCPYECIFCSQRAVSGRRYRSRSAQRVFQELEALVRTYGQRFIFINDDNFLVNRTMVRELCDLIIGAGFPPELRIGFNGRGDAMDADLLRHMRRAQFAFVLIGFETGSERLMTMIKKGETVRQIADGVRAAKAAGLTVGGQFILGFPTETRAESWQTVRHALRLSIDFVRFNLLVPYPGTEVFDLVKKTKGMSNGDWSRYATHGGLTGKGAPYIPEGRSERELVRLQWLGHLLFYLRPRQLLNLRNMQYATGGQITLPAPTTVRGCAELARFGWRLFIHLLKGMVRKASRAGGATGAS